MRLRTDGGGGSLTFSTIPRGTRIACTVVVLPLSLPQASLRLSPCVLCNADKGDGAVLLGENGTSSRAGDNTDTLCVGLGAATRGNINGSDTATFRRGDFGATGMELAPPLLPPAVDNETREEPAREGASAYD